MKGSTAQTATTINLQGISLVYFEYWRDKILPLEESQKKTALGSFIMEFFGKLYGRNAMLDLGFTMLEYSMNNPQQARARE